MTSTDTSAPSFDPSFAEPRGWSLRRLMAPIAVGLALLSAFLTFAVLTGLTPIQATHNVVVIFYLINAATILLLVLIILREVWQLVQARRRGRAAARLHVQIVSLFSAIAVLPAVLVSIVAYVTLDRGLDRLFSGPTREAIENSRNIATAYMNEHGDLIVGDIIGMANDIARARPLYEQDRGSFHELLAASAASRNLRGAMLIDKDGNVLMLVDKDGNVKDSTENSVEVSVDEDGKVAMSADKDGHVEDSAKRSIQQHDFTVPPPEILSNSALVNETLPYTVIIPEGNYVASVIRLRYFEDTFLHVARPLDPRLVAQVDQTMAGANDYVERESRRLGIQVAFALMFTVIALTVLMSSVLIGLNFANWLVAPIRRLMGAANMVSAGDLHAQVPVLKSEGDLANLGETFNKMTQELRSQRNELVSASEVIDSRRRFIEAVLSSASAGIVGVDGSGSIGILNRSAEKLLGHSESETLGDRKSVV